MNSSSIIQDAKTHDTRAHQTRTETSAKQWIQKNLIHPFEKLSTVYSSIYFLNSKFAGFLILIITTLHPRIGFIGILSMLITWGLLKMFSISIDSAQGAVTLLNSLLTGLLIGDMYLLDAKVFFFLVMCMIFNLCATAFFEMFFQSRRLPVLSMPFSLTALLIGLIAPHLTFFADARIYYSDLTSLPFLQESFQLFFKALGSIFCLPDALIGGLMWIAVFIESPLTSLFLMAGYFLGFYSEALLQSNSYETFRFYEGFNYSLVFTAFAGYFLVPSRFSIVFACFAVFFTSIFLKAGETLLAPLHLQVMALPFNFISLMSLLVLKNLKPFSLSTAFFNSPESALERNRTLLQRHRFGEVGLFLPVQGKNLIQQGFNGPLTHKGLWQHALDFVTVDDNKKVYANKGFELSDYFAFGQDVFAPMLGTVIAVLATDSDNLIGQVANTRNWGNYIIIRSYSGICVTLSHLKKDSCLVKVGDFVQAGQKVAQIGNSGYSQEPHLHMQAHWTPAIGAATVPFHLINYYSDKKVYFHKTPLAGEVVCSAPHNQAVEKILNFKVSESMNFKTTNGKTHKEELITIQTLVNEFTGAFYLSDGVSRLSFSKVGWQFYFYDLEGTQWSPLWDLFAVAPKIPMTYGQALSYSDDLPDRLAITPLFRMFTSLFQLIKGDSSATQGTYQINEQGLEIVGHCPIHGRETKTFLKIDPALGIQQFSVGSKIYARSI